MDKTSLGFQKPKEEEYYDINIFNQNAQLANDMIEKNSSAIGQKLDKNSSFYADFESYYGNTKLVDDFQDISQWSANSATPETDSTNAKLGSQSLKVSEINNIAGVLNVYKNLSSPLDLTKLGNGEESTDDDYLKIAIYISDATKVEYIALAFGQTVDTITLNRKVIILTQANLVTGWNYFNPKKSHFGTEGDGAWSNINISVLEWRSTANAQNAYVSFQLIQLVKADLDTLLNRPNPFQKFGVKEFDINSGEWFVGYEFGEIIAKELSSYTTMYGSLKGLKKFNDCIIYATKEVTGSSTTEAYLQYYLDDSNYITALVLNDRLTLRVRENGVSVETSTPFNITLGDTITYKIEKINGKVELTAIKNMRTVTLATLQGESNLTEGYLSIGASVSGMSKFFNASISEVSHVYHSDVAEVAEKTLELTNLGIGYQTVASELDLDKYFIGGKFITPSTGLIHLPVGWSQGRHTIDVTGGESYVTQVISPDIGSVGQLPLRMAVRFGKSLNQTPYWSDWKEISWKETPTVTVITSGFAPGWSGTIKISKTQENTLIYYLETLTKTTDIIQSEIVYTIPDGLRGINGARKNVIGLNSSSAYINGSLLDITIGPSGTIRVANVGSITSNVRRVNGVHLFSN